MVERPVRDREVAGSNPVAPTRNSLLNEKKAVFWIKFGQKLTAKNMFLRNQVFRDIYVSGCGGRQFSLYLRNNQISDATAITARYGNWGKNTVYSFS